MSRLPSTHAVSAFPAARLGRAVASWLLVAQFAIATPVAAQEEIIHRDHGGGGLRDIGAGIAIGIGTELLRRQLMRPPDEQTAAKPPVARKTPVRKARVAKKPDNKKDKKPEAGKAPPPPAVEPLPTPVAGDSKDGIAVEGGVVHRGTGVFHAKEGDRGAIFCWVDPTASAPCTDFQWFQFSCLELKIDLGKGKGFEVPPGDELKHISIESATGAYMKIGVWSADDHQSMRNKKRHKMFGDPVPACPDVKDAPTGGAYATPPDIHIPGLAKLKSSDTKRRLQRFVDAPMGLPAVKDIADRLHLDQRMKLDRDEKMPTQEKSPADGDPIIMEFTFHFRTALYCADKCLGQFNWTSVEKIRVIPKVMRIDPRGPIGAFRLI